MERNLGTTDKAIRILIAVIISLLFISEIAPTTLTVILFVPAGVCFVTGISGFCPLYTAYGIRTCKDKDPRA
ncbi:YgaP family membrane protein [Salinimicrobium flavum]|uniref:DUF2892 domain-containing protein n=1 Tax=Salinimicrobium flavum TaxID=1737065 RepID=A0ABW5IZ12_9FLAO